MAAYQWVNSFSQSGIPTSALDGGVDIDGHQIYVGRAYHNGEWIPGKVIPGRNIAYIASEGKEYRKDRFQVLCEQRFDWVKVTNGNIPTEAVEGGRTSDGKLLYIGRVVYGGSNTVGKVSSETKLCYIPFSGKELEFKEYEILVLRT
ncbi:uncharacterized protein LOC109597016 [Aethina tumida]|uniref:uncharacterized protein LOC109597016 n=1 Tax=Aethina tumida TaxID=116153 RepID=UPI00096B45E0|nr:uncharacterized protein LOC109597016 [Aethina tumida]